MRALKLLITNVSIKRKQRQVMARVGAHVGSQENALVELEFHEWCRRVCKFHTTKVAADMYAEYLAIGCSYAIVFFFSGHLNFFLGPPRRVADGPAEDESTSGLADSLFGESQVLVLVLPLGTELLVDWVSCCVEPHVGELDFLSFERDRLFYIAFFVTIAVLNIYVSSVLFLIPDT